MNRDRFPGGVCPGGVSVEGRGQIRRASTYGRTRQTACPDPSTLHRSDRDRRRRAFLSHKADGSQDTVRRSRKDRRAC